MENEAAKKIPIEINGTKLVILTREDESSVRKIAEDLDKRISELRRNRFRVTLADAALLCAIENAGDKMQADGTIRSLEAQVSLCEMTIRNLRDEISGLKKKLSEAEAAVSSNDVPGRSSESGNDRGIISRLGLSDYSAEERISALEKYLESRSNESGRNNITRTDKIRYIESLLREGLDTND